MLRCRTCLEALHVRGGQNYHEGVASIRVVGVSPAWFVSRANGLCDRVAACATNYSGSYLHYRARDYGGSGG